MTLTNTNPPRKNPADQNDRLDHIFDGLSEGLNEAVATAVKEAVTSGVQQAIVEVLTNPELQQLLRPPTPPMPDPAPPEATGGGGFLGRLWRAVRGTAQRVGKAAGRAERAVGGWLAATARKARELVAGGVQKVRRGACTLYAWVLTNSLAKVVGVGGLIAAALCLGNPALAGAVGGAALAVAAAVSQLPAHVLALFARTVSNH